MQDSISNSPGYMLRRATNAMTALLVKRLAEHDLRLVEATVLLLVAEQPAITASAIGRMLDIQRANMVPLLKRLEDALLIEREPIDGKSQGLTLSAHGAEKVIGVQQTVKAFEDELLERIPAAHREHFVPALRALWP